MSILHADIAAALPELRAEAEGRMVDTCVIGAESNEVDPDTLDTVVTPGSVQYEGKCRIASRSSAVSERESAGQAFSEQSLVLSIPVAESGNVRVNSIVKVTAVDAVTGDPAMVGRRFRVAGLASGSQATAARFPVVWV